MTEQAATFGIEIEFKSPLNSAVIAEAITAAGISCAAEYYNHSNRPHWKITTDASVRNGWELVSPVLAYGEEAFAQVETVCNVLQGLGVKIDRQCGLHVHHGVAGMTDAQVAKIVAIYAKFEQTIDNMMPASRRGSANRYGASLKVRPSWKESVAAINACKTREELVAVLPTRYMKVNVHSLFRHGTVEFRQHSGTVEASKIVSWVKITRAMVERGAKTSRVSIRDDRPDPSLFRGIIGKELAGYFRDRTRQLAAAA